MKPGHIRSEPCADFAGFRVKLMQAGPHEYIAAIETEDGEEAGRSPRYLPSPYAALEQAIESIEAHQGRETSQ